MKTTQEVLARRLQDAHQACFEFEGTLKHQRNKLCLYKGNGRIQYVSVSEVRKRLNEIFMAIGPNPD